MDQGRQSLTTEPLPRKGHDMPRIYRTLGTDRHGGPAQVRERSASSARISVGEMNRAAEKRGHPQNWRGEYADVEHLDQYSDAKWLPLDTSDD